jgi:hypothetical protein
MVEADKPEAPDGSFAGFLFLLIMAMTAVLGVAQLVIAKQFVTLGLAVIVIAGLFTAFLVRAAHSPRAGENDSEES